MTRDKELCRCKQIIEEQREQITALKAELLRLVYRPTAERWIKLEEQLTKLELKQKK